MTKQKTQPAYKNKPHKVNDSMLLSEKIGRVRVSVFEKFRESDESHWYSVSICRWFKDRNTGEFRQGSFVQEDLDNVEKAAKLARDVIRKRRYALLAELQDEPEEETA